MIWTTNEALSEYSDNEGDDNFHHDSLSSPGGPRTFTEKQEEESSGSAEEHEDFEEEEHNKSGAIDTDQCKQKYCRRNRVDKPSVDTEEQAPPPATLKIWILKQSKICQG